MLLAIALIPFALLSVMAATKQKGVDHVMDSMQAHLGQESYDHGMFGPTEDLGVLSRDEYSTLSHPAFPNYSVRIKKSKYQSQWCHPCHPLRAEPHNPSTLAFRL